jgi:hypothetical protein
VRWRKWIERERERERALAFGSKDCIGTVLNWYVHTFLYPNKKHEKPTCTTVSQNGFL